MNPAVFAANHAVTVSLAAAAAKRQALKKRLETLAPEEATRERVLEDHPELEPVLQQMLEQRMLRLRGDGTLRYDPEVGMAAARASGKVALLVASVLVLVGATVAIMLFALAP